MRPSRSTTAGRCATRSGPSLVNYINDNFDAVVVGGGGLFLRDTNANQRSGLAVEHLRWSSCAG